MKPRKKQIFKGENSATALVPLLPAALCALPLRQEGLGQCPWVLAASGNDTWLGGVSSILQRSKVGCLWVRIALPLPAGLHGDTGGRGPGCGWHTQHHARSTTSHLSCTELLQRGSGWTHVPNRPCLIKGLHHIYSKSLQENMARNSARAISC